MAIKNNDFVELEFTGKTKDEEFIFDTTDAKIAQENGLGEDGQAIEPKIICVGQGQVLKGLDKDLIGKEEGKEYKIEISAEDGFGKKSAKLVQLVPTKVFRKQNINPVPGLQVNIDNNMGIIKTVSGGRTLVDFNHPLSSQELVYEYKITKVITDTKEKADNYIKVSIGLPLESEYNNGTYTIKLEFELPDQIKEQIEQKTKEVIPEIKKVEFKEKPKDAGKDSGNAKKDKSEKEESAKNKE